MWLGGDEHRWQGCWIPALREFCWGPLGTWWTAPKERHIFLITNKKRQGKVQLKVQTSFLPYLLFSLLKGVFGVFPVLLTEQKPHHVFCHRLCSPLETLVVRRGKVPFGGRLCWGPGKGMVGRGERRGYLGFLPGLGYSIPTLTDPPILQAAKHVF